MYKSILIIIFIFITSQAQFNVSVHIPMPPQPPVPPPGFVILPTDDERMNRSDLVVINPNQIGYWVQIPYGTPGRYVLHCRTMRYDRDLGEWFYGPWYENYSMTLDRYRRSSFYNKHFNDYMKERYPTYYNKRFRHSEKYEWKENQDQDKSKEKNKNWRYDELKKSSKNKRGH